MQGRIARVRLRGAAEINNVLEAPQAFFSEQHASPTRSYAFAGVTVARFVEESSGLCRMRRYVVDSLAESSRYSQLVQVGIQRNDVLMLVRRSRGR